MCVDGVFSTIGSFNFDLYSARRNLEVGVAVFDRSFALRMQVTTTAAHDDGPSGSRWVQ